MSIVTLTMKDLETRVGEEVAVSPWIDVSQERINRFAEATNDFQWLHVDVEKAKNGPFGTTIAHGFLVLALISPLTYVTYEVTGTKSILNLGSNKVRFKAPVPSGSMIRAHFRIQEAKKLENGAIDVTWKITVERQGSDKPCVESEILARYF